LIQSLRADLASKVSALNSARLTEAEHQSALGHALGIAEQAKHALVQEQARAAAALKLIEAESAQAIRDLTAERDVARRGQQTQLEVVKAQNAEKMAREAQLHNVTAAYHEAIRAGEALNAQLQALQANLAVVENDAREKISVAQQLTNQAQEDARNAADQVKV